MHIDFKSFVLYQSLIDFFAAYVNDSQQKDDAGSSVDVDSRHAITNVHPESGVDHSSILKPIQRSWETPSPARTTYRRKLRWQNFILH